MKRICLAFAELTFAGLLIASFDSSVAQPANQARGAFAGWATNGPAVYRLYVSSIQGLPGPPLSYDPPPLEFPVEIRRALMTFRVAANLSYVTNTVRQFDHFLPESLNNVVWTNFIAHTNGRSMAIWTERTFPVDWPARPPKVQWNRKSLIWGMRGLTALSPAWQGQGAAGGAPITALSRRHGYTRGHSMGPDRIGTDLRGLSIWFLTAGNSLIKTKVARQVVRTRETSNRDYTIVLFDSDLPESIQPMRVLRAEDVLGPLPSKYLRCWAAPFVFFKTEQLGNVSAEFPGFTVDTMKIGDSGSPNMLPLPGELVFRDGRTTWPVSREMQADMDELCRLEGLDPSRYQLQYVDLTAYPSYTTY